MDMTGSAPSASSEALRNKYRRFCVRGTDGLMDLEGFADFLRSCTGLTVSPADRKRFFMDAHMHAHTGEAGSTSSRLDFGSFVRALTLIAQGKFAFVSTPAQALEGLLQTYVLVGETSAGVPDVTTAKDEMRRASGSAPAGAPPPLPPAAAVGAHASGGTSGAQPRQRRSPDLADMTPDRPESVTKDSAGKSSGTSSTSKDHPHDALGRAGPIADVAGAGLGSAEPVSSAAAHAADIAAREAGLQSPSRGGGGYAARHQKKMASSPGRGRGTGTDGGEVDSGSGGGSGAGAGVARSGRPAPIATAPVVPSSVVWKAYVDDRGYHYYYHAGTGTTQWEPPHEPYWSADGMGIVQPVPMEAVTTPALAAAPTPASTASAGAGAGGDEDYPAGRYASEPRADADGGDSGAAVSPSKLDTLRGRRIFGYHSPKKAAWGEGLEPSHLEEVSDGRHGVKARWRGAWSAVIEEQEGPGAVQSVVSGGRRSHSSAGSSKKEPKDKAFALGVAGSYTLAHGKGEAREAAAAKARAVYNTNVDVGTTSWTAKKMNSEFDHKHHMDLMKATVNQLSRNGRNDDRDFVANLRTDLYDRAHVPKAALKPRYKTYSNKEWREKQEAAHKAGKSVYERLTDHRGYTGTHKFRFDKDGRGRGMAGRERLEQDPDMFEHEMGTMPDNVPQWLTLNPSTLPVNSSRLAARI